MARSTAATKLSKYRAMRDFSKTREPSGAKAPPRAGSAFVIQKHAARRLHYPRALHLFCMASAARAAVQLQGDMRRLQLTA